MEEKRLNKFLSEAGVCSRREADRLIENGKVIVDGHVAIMGEKVTAESVIKVDGKKVESKEPFVLIAYNKPVGIECTSDRKNPDNIIDAINYPLRIFNVGRLDKNSQGLILMTNDGSLVNQIMKASNHHEKEYVVRVNKPVTEEFIKGMSQGVPILDTVTRKCDVWQIDKFTFGIVLTQGLNRQIRRMSEYFGYKVVNLKRIRIINIKLGKLKSGTYRLVTKEELRELYNLLGRDLEEK